MSNRKILHVDMDSFYASLEKERKGLEGPIVICVYSGRTEDSGAVSTCSYEARDLGIHAAMPITRAKEIADESGQEVHFLPMDREYYRQVSDEIREQIYENYTERIEQASIDEAYLDTTGEVESFEEAEAIAKEIQKEVEEKFGITCSVGIGPNKLVAKIASDREKPEGLTVVKPDEVDEFMRSLDLEDIHGIGDKTVEKLEALGITSVEELAKADTRQLIEEFGQNLGVKIQEKARGVDDESVEERGQKQITRITTLDQNSRSVNHIKTYFPDLADEIFEQLDDKGLYFGKVVLVVIDSDIQMHTRSKTLKARIQDKEKFIEVEEALLEDFMDGFDGEVRRIGLRVSDLEEGSGQRRLGSF
ncbi:DNA polymerase IV [Candidatus Nanohaloarchaea archaeon]|nr:DNA polymerase IV [Candidatus Nanohaloarchaea archaeon]